MQTHGSGTVREAAPAGGSFARKRSGTEDIMKIGEAQQIYREQVKAYQEQKHVLSERLKQVQERQETALDDEERSMFSKDAAVLELSIRALDEKQEEYRDYLSELTDQYAAYWNAAVSEQQADAYKEYAEEMGKIMEVARRLMKGAIVPQADEKKLMDFDYELYLAAKTTGEMVRRQKEQEGKKKEEYDTLWGDEEEKTYEDPQEAADNATAANDGPALVSPEDTLAGVFAAEE